MTHVETVRASRWDTFFSRSIQVVNLIGATAKMLLAVYGLWRAING